MTFVNDFHEWEMYTPTKNYQKLEPRSHIGTNPSTVPLAAVGTENHRSLDTTL